MGIYNLSNTSLALIALLLLGLAFTISKKSYQSEFADIPEVLKFADSCETLSGKHPDTLVIAVQRRNMAIDILNSLCSNKLVSQQFGNVKVHWHTNEKEMLEFVGQGQVDLILIKDNFIRAFNSDIAYGYEEIASYKDYSAFLIGHKEKPLLEKEYLLGKRIGLLDYASSRSGHIAPMTLFKELGLTGNQVNIIYAKSHQQLRHLLETGKVDIISSYWGEEDNNRLTIDYRTPLISSISGSKWYMKAAKKNPALKCALQQELGVNAQSQSGYYHQISMSNHCEDDGA